MLPSFCKDVVTRLRPKTTESRGKTVPDWSVAPDYEEIDGCSMQPASTSLSTDGRVLGISDLWTLYAPSDADIQAGDRIEFSIRRPMPYGEREHINVKRRRKYKPAIA